MHRLDGVCARLEVADVEVRQSVVDEAVHGAVHAVHVLVDQPRDEVRGEGDDKGLGGTQSLLKPREAYRVHDVQTAGLKVAYGHETYVDDDRHLAEASQEVVPDACRETERNGLQRSPADGTSTEVERLRCVLCGRKVSITFRLD